MKLKILELLKTKKKILEDTKQEKIIPDTNDIEIIIENNSNIFENETEIIMQNAQILLENKSVDTLEDGIIVFAVMFRGLKKGKIEKDENGKTIITLIDTTSKNTLKK